MAVGDEEIEATFFSLSLSSMENKQSMGVPSDEPSPEDVAWADSCFIKYPEMSENGWYSLNSLRDAISESVSSEPDSPAASREDYPREANIEISSSSREIEMSMDTSIDGVFPNIEGADKNTEAELINEESENLRYKINLENVFLPTYNENLKNIGTSDAEEVDFPGLIMEQSAVHIFKVWDLGVPTEEEFIKQLNEALAESSVEPSSSVPDDSGPWKGLQDISIDDIISGMADLSLNHISL